MNTVVTSKEAIVAVSIKIAAVQGLDKISIREVAKNCNVAVGSIYNYFPSKADLITATVEEVWKEIFHKTGACDEFTSFVALVKWVYDCIYQGTQDFPAFFSIHFQGFDSSEKEKGKQLMGEYRQHMVDQLVSALHRDKKVKREIFQSMDEMQFISFVFGNMLLMLSAKEKDCSVLLTIIEKVLYN